MLEKKSGEATVTIEAYYCIDTNTILFNYIKDEDQNSELTKFKGNNLVMLPKKYGTNISNLEIYYDLDVWDFAFFIDINTNSEHINPEILCEAKSILWQYLKSTKAIRNK